MNTKLSFFDRLNRLFSKPKEDQIKSFKNKTKNFLDFFFKIPFIFGKPFFRSTYLSYKPDSYDQHKEHEEFINLYKKFTNKNKINNGGDSVRLWSFILNIKQIVSDKIEGNFAEVGVYKGNTAAIFAYYANLYRRKVFLFDTYEGFNSKDLHGVDSDKFIDFDDTSINLVKEVIGEHVNACDFVKGHFPESVNENHKNQKFSIVSLDCDLYEPTKAGLDFFYPRMTPGGIFFLHDYSNIHWNGSKKAIDEFLKLSNEKLILIPDKSGSAFFRKSK
tara:strand:- start:194 stop:1018 length:825 start_codon:yes stop_codon:yes gene_type:complete